MIRALLIPALAFAGSALAEPRFADRSANLPGGHVYGGGWEHFVGGGVTAFDCDADGDLDLVAAGGENPARLWRNATPGPGADLVFEALDLPTITGVTGLYALDIDSDGWRDLFVLRAGPNRVLRGGPDCAFADAAQQFAVAPGNAWSTAFSATWEPGADRPTLAIGNYVDRDDPDGPFEACDDNTLQRPTPQGYGSQPLAPGYCALSLLFSDASRKGRADLRISNDRHYYVRGGSEQMWRMPDLALLGPEQGFKPISIWGMGIASEDITGDGLPEVMLTSMGDQLLQFAGGGFAYETAPYATGATAHRPHAGDDGRPSTGWHAAFGDVDNDGRSDLFIAKGNVDQMPGNAMRDPNSLLRQLPDGSFTEVSVAAGVASDARSRGAALADFDGDGRIDLAVVNRRAPMELYQNVTPDAGHWIAVTPRQSQPNGFAVGAFVEMKTAGTQTRIKEITVGGGHGGHVAGPVHFGLGDRTQAVLRVIWPDGTASHWTTLPADRVHTLWRND